MDVLSSLGECGYRGRRSLLRRVAAAPGRVSRMFFLAGLVLIQGCVSVDPYQGQLEQWHGRNQTDLMLVWGVPDEIKERDGAGDEWIYRHEEVIRIPSGSVRYYSSELRDWISPPHGTRLPRKELKVSCTTRFVMARGEIRSSRFDGDGCLYQEGLTPPRLQA